MRSLFLWDWVDWAFFLAIVGVLVFGVAAITHSVYWEATHTCIRSHPSHGARCQHYGSTFICTPYTYTVCDEWRED